MSRFYLVRDGTDVAEGVMFADGSIALRWISNHASTNVYKSLHDVKAIHVVDHPGTSIRWKDALEDHTWVVD